MFIFHKCIRYLIDYYVYVLSVHHFKISDFELWQIGSPLSFKVGKEYEWVVLGAPHCLENMIRILFLSMQCNRKWYIPRYLQCFYLYDLISKFRFIDSEVIIIFHLFTCYTTTSELIWYAVCKKCWGIQSIHFGVVENWWLVTPPNFFYWKIDHIESKKIFSYTTKWLLKLKKCYKRFKSNILATKNWFRFSWIKLWHLSFLCKHKRGS